MQPPRGDGAVTTGCQSYEQLGIRITAPPLDGRKRTRAVRGSRKNDDRRLEVSAALGGGGPEAGCVR